MDNTFYKHILILKQAIEHNKLVVFAGAGVSRDAGIPTWYELKNELKKDINIDESENDALKIAQLYFNERGEKEYIDRVRQILKFNQTRYLPTHELIFKLNPLHVLTTNFDDLFEQVIDDKLYPFSTIAKDSDFPFALNTNFLVKVHGDLSEANIILKEDDFLSYSRNHPLFDSFIKSIFASKVVLFVGYSFSDPNLQAIIQQVKDILGQRFQYAYLFNSASTIHSSQKDYLKNKGIQLISYSEHSEKIEKFLNQENSQKAVFARSYSLSDEGQRTCNFLNFLRNYNYYNEDLKGKNFIDRLFESLQRFKDLVSLDGNFIVRLYPLNTYLHNAYVIDTDNQELLSLYRDHAKIESDSIRLTNSTILGISEGQLASYEEKLKTITKQLNFAGIIAIRSTASSERNTPFINILLKLPECNCLSCRYLAFKLDEVSADMLGGGDNLNLNEKLLYGFMAYQFGDYERSIAIFSQIASEAWKAHRYLLYYLSKKNILSLHNLVKFDFGIAAQKKEELLTYIKDTDLDKLLLQMSGLSEDEYKLLRSIRDQDVLIETRDTINDQLINIEASFQHFRNDGWAFQLGNTDIHKLLTALNKLFAFYWNNNIVLDAYRDFTDIVNKAFEGVIISYATSDAYNNAKLDQFSAYILRLMVLYGDDSRLEKTINKCDINNFLISETNKEEFIGFFKNYLKSFFDDRNNFLKVVNPSIKSNLRFDRFSRNCSKYFSNFLLLLSHLELADKLSSNIIDDLLRFLEVQDFLRWTDLENLPLFMKRHAKLFNDEQLRKLVKLSESKLQVMRRQGNFWWAVFAIKNQNLSEFIIDDKDVINNVLMAKSEQDADYHDALMALYFLVDEGSKKDIKKKIVKILGSKFSRPYYEYLVANKIIEQEDYLDKYLNSLDFKCAIEISNGLPRWVDSVAMGVLNTITFIIARKFKLKGLLLTKVNQAPSFVKVALLPESYDYKDFEIKWLYLYKNRPEVLQALSKSKKFMEIFRSRRSEISNAKLQALCFKYFT